MRERKKVGFSVTNGCGKPVVCKGKMDYYCPSNDDFSSTWVVCLAAAPGASVNCQKKSCRSPRQIRLKKLKCSYK